MGHVEVVQLLLDHGARASAQDRDGETPIFKGTKKNQVSCVEALVIGGAEDMVSAGETAGTGDLLKGWQSQQVNKGI